MPENRNIQVAHLVIAVLLVLGSFATAWLSINVRLTVLETKDAQKEIFDKELKQDLKELKSGQMEIILKLENKKNRDN